MNWTVEYIAHWHYVDAQVEGSFKLSDHFRKIDEIVAQEYWTPGINILFDCTKLDFSRCDYNDMRQMALNFVDHDALIGCGKIALLTKSTGDFGRGRQFEMYSDEKICANVKIFIDKNLALRWLEVNHVQLHDISPNADSIGS